MLCKRFLHDMTYEASLFALDIFVLYLKPISHRDCDCRRCALLLRSSHDFRGHKAAARQTHDDI